MFDFVIICIVIDISKVVIGRLVIDIVFINNIDFSFYDNICYVLQKRLRLNKVKSYMGWFLYQILLS